MLGLLGLLASGCGGGGGDGSAPLMEGSTQSRSLSSAYNGTTYPLDVYVPPGSESARATLPVVYLLDGPSRFRTLVDIAEFTKTRVIIVGIGKEDLRGRDYVPPNACTPFGGGHAAFLDFIRLELSPFIEANVGGHPQRRILLGHSHGGSFVLYAMFAQAPGAHHFSAYLASDASIGCMEGTVNGWESDYAAAHSSLPVRLHVSYGGNLVNGTFVLRLQARQYSGLALAAQLYGGGHIGMIPAAFADALAFALP